MGKCNFNREWMDYGYEEKGFSGNKHFLKMSPGIYGIYRGLHFFLKEKLIVWYENLYR